jgi:hypothetical protein
MKVIRFYICFFINVGNMAFDSAFGDKKSVGYFPVSIFIDKQFYYVVFPFGDIVVYYE